MPARHSKKSIECLGIRKSDDLTIKDIILASEQNHKQVNYINKCLMNLPRELKIKYFSHAYEYYHTLNHYRIIGMLKDKYVYCSLVISHKTCEIINSISKEFNMEWKLLYYCRMEAWIKSGLKRKKLCGEKKHYLLKYTRSFIPKVLVNIIDDYVFWFEECIEFK